MTELDSGMPQAAEVLPHQEIFKVTPIVFVMLTRTIDGRKQIYLQHKFSTHLWTLPGGHLEDGESGKMATVRETEEEVGVTVSGTDLKKRYIADIKDPDGQRYCRFYETQAWQGEPFNKEPEKCDDVGWFNIGSLPEDMNPYTKQCLREIELLPENVIGQGEYGYEQAA